MNSEPQHITPIYLEDIYMYDFGDELAQTYTETCCCGEEVEVSTQKDEHPEYRTEVNVRCQNCGSSVCFLLPVN